MKDRRHVTPKKKKSTTDAQYFIVMCQRNKNITQQNHSTIAEMSQVLWNDDSKFEFRGQERFTQYNDCLQSCLRHVEALSSFGALFSISGIWHFV